MLHTMLTSCLVDCRASLLCTLMELRTLEDRQHEIRANYTGFSITVADVRIKRPPVSEVDERKSTCQFDFLWTRLFYCTKHSTVYPTKWNYIWARHSSRHTVKYTWWPVSGHVTVGKYMAWNLWHLNLNYSFCISMQAWHGMIAWEDEDTRKNQWSWAAIDFSAVHM